MPLPKVSRCPIGGQEVSTEMLPVRIDRANVVTCPVCDRRHLFNPVTGELRDLAEHIGDYPSNAATA
jgi:ribosome-binding protein aMBF1 (putative translation factor)